MPLVPRGGDCPLCHNYILWGDVVRAIYRRDTVIQNRGGGIGNDDFNEDEDFGEIFESDNDTDAGIVPKRTRSKPARYAPSTSTKTQERHILSAKAGSPDSSMEEFDLEGVESDTEIPFQLHKSSPMQTLPSNVSKKSRIVRRGSVSDGEQLLASESIIEE